MDLNGYVYGYKRKEKMQTEQDTEQDYDLPKVKSIIIFKAPWCQPCKAYASIVEKVKENFKHDSNIKFEFWDIEDKDSWQVTLKYKIKGVPTTILLINDVEVKRITGLLTESNLTELIEFN
jgi:thioredoxin 1